MRKERLEKCKQKKIIGTFKRVERLCRAERRQHRLLKVVILATAAHRVAIVGELNARLVTV